MVTTTTFFRFFQATLLTAVLFFTKSTLYSQNRPDAADYDYAAFRFPDIDRKALDAQFNLTGNVLQNVNREPVPEENRVSSFLNNLNLTYSRFRNTERLQSQQDFNLNQGFTSSRGQNDGSKNRYNRFNASLGISTVNRAYYKPKRFFEYNLFFNTSYETINQKSDNPFLDQKSWNFSLNASLPLKIGKGRIEPIDDIFLAKFMVDELLKNGLIDTAFGQEELFSLGRVMATARNRRIFDFRRQRIYELTQLDSWFKEHGLGESQSNILYFTTLTDNWLYAFRNIRQAGVRYALSVEPVALFYYRKNFNPKNSSGYFGARVYGEYVKERPVNQFWQEGANISAGIEYLNHPITGKDLLNNIWLRPFVRAALNYGYFPNSRTALFANAALRYEYYWADPDNLALFDYHVIRPSVGLNMTYFINYQFRIDAYLNGSYSWASDNARDSFHSEPLFPFSMEERSSRLALLGNVTLRYSFF